MFNFIVRYFGFLKHVPLAAWVADALMFIWYSVFDRKIIRAIDRIEEEVSTWNGMKITIHKFGGLQFNYQNKEIGHIHSNGILDILFNLKTKHALLEMGLASDHHVFNRSGWISYYVRKEEDAALAIGLLMLALNCRRSTVDLCNDESMFVELRNKRHGLNPACFYLIPLLQVFRKGCLEREQFVEIWSWMRGVRVLPWDQGRWLSVSEDGRV